MSSHPVVVAAARGEVPSWARFGKKRRAHAGRVAALMAEWTDRLGLDAEERIRWLAAAWLHDSLKDASDDELRGILGEEFTDVPGPVLHGPAAAACLRDEGVEDRELLAAIAYHTLGHPEFGSAGCALFAADFLEPGRRRRRRWRSGLRARMPGDLLGVTRDILEARILYLLHEKRPVRRETIGFWNRLAEGDEWARASEV